MDDYRKQLRNEIAAYEGRHDDLIAQVPAMFDLLVGILEDPELPQRQRPLILAAMAYFIIPADVLPEEIYGPEGYLDDLYLTARAALEVRDAAGDDILVRNWEGEGDVVELLQEVIRRANEMLAEGIAEQVLRYVGWDVVVGPPKPHHE